MSGMPRVDTAVAAASVVGVADQIMRGVHDNKDHRPSDAQSHYIKAAIAGAIAIGAFEMLKKDEPQARGTSEYTDDSEYNRDAIRTGSYSRSRSRSRSQSRSRSSSRRRHHHDAAKYKHHSDNTKDLIAQTVGAYSLGRQIMGHTDHTILKLVAEGLGLAALANDADKELNH